ncbi:MAG: tRNA (guanine(46)-N(7))-methyltransferase TrmB [Ardenticatenaceae bacterium]
MVRKALTRNVKATPPEPDVAAKYMHFWRKGDLYLHPDQFPMMSSQTLFGNESPLELEVGCGTAEFLCSLAAQEPGVNFLGVDVWTKVVYEAVRTAAAQGLDNIKLIRAPFEFTHHLLVPNSLRKVYVHYPNPHLRSRGQHKVFNAAFLDAIYEALEADGRLHVVTDHRELFFEEMLPLVEEDERWEKTHEERYLVGYDPPVKSRYQLMWEKHGVEPLRFEVKKR